MLTTTTATKTGPVYKGKKHKFVMYPTHKQRLGNYDEIPPLPPNTFIALPEHFEYARLKARMKADADSVFVDVAVEPTEDYHGMMNELLRREDDEDFDSERQPNTFD